MARRQKEWAQRAAAALRALLGDKCAECGSPAGPFEFDCIRPMGHRHHRIEISARLSFYRAQYRAGNLQLLCQKCHNIKTSFDTPDLSILGYRCHRCRHTWQDDAIRLCPACYP